MSVGGQQAVTDDRVALDVLNAISLNSDSAFPASGTGPVAKAG